MIRLRSCLFLLICSLLPAQQTPLDRAYAEAQKTLAAGNLPGARRQFEALSHAHPQIAELHATLGALLFQQGDFTAAMRELQQAKHLKPDLPKLDGLIGMTEAELGHHTTAIAPLEDAFHTATEAPVKRLNGLELERAYTAAGQHSKAVTVALELQQLFPDDPEVLYHNERIFGNFAYLTVQSLVKAAPESVWRYQAQAEAEESQGAHDAAISDYTKALVLDPNRRGLHYRLGRCLRERARDSHQQQDLKLAMSEFEAELKLNPGNASANFEIGELHRLAGDLSPARASFEAALRTYPDFPEANLGLGTVLDAMGEPAAALPILQKAADATPLEEAVWYRLAQVQRELGHKEQQFAALKRFRELHTGSGAKVLAPETDVSRQVLEPEPK